MIMHQWIDRAARDPGQLQKGTARLGIEGHALRIQLIHDGFRWWVSCDALRVYAQLQAQGVSSAKAEALEHVQTQLERMKNDLDAMKLAR